MRKFNIIEVLIELEQNPKKLFKHITPCGDYFTATVDSLNRVSFNRFSKEGVECSTEFKGVTVFVGFNDEWYEVTND